MEEELNNINNAINAMGELAVGMSAMYNGLRKEGLTTDVAVSMVGITYGTLMKQPYDEFQQGEEYK